VFFGSGDDGVFCLDAVTGAERWHYKAPVHVDASPAVVGGRLYVGSGVSRAFPAPEVFCLDAARGAPVWRTPTDLPAGGPPAGAGGRVLVGLGNGRLVRSAAPPEKPAGALLCLDAATGKPCWRHDAGDAVHARPAVAEDRVYFTSRDGACYAVGRGDG